MSLCVNGKHGSPRMALDGARLCPACVGRLRRDLLDLERLWPELPLFLLPGSGQRGEKVSGKRFSPPAPVRLEVVDALWPKTSDVIGPVVSTARGVIEARRLSADPGDDVAAAAKVIEHHLEWAIAQEQALDLMLAVGRAANEVKRLVGEQDKPPIGRCPDIDPRGEQDRCSGPLHWLDDGSLGVRCGRCLGVWNEADLIGLARVIDVYLPKREVSDLTGASMAKISSWARTGKVKTQGRDRVSVKDVWHAVSA